MWMILYFPMPPVQTHPLPPLLYSMPQEADLYGLPDPGSLAGRLLVGSEQTEATAGAGKVGKLELSYQLPPC